MTEVIKERKIEKNKIKELTISLDDFEKSMLKLIESYKFNKMNKITLTDDNVLSYIDSEVK